MIITFQVASCVTCGCSAKLGAKMNHHFCLVCILRVDTASKRRLIHPITEANAGVHEFSRYSA